MLTKSKLALTRSADTCKAKFKLIVCTREAAHTFALYRVVPIRIHVSFFNR